jgi:hypothetical protein
MGLSAWPESMLPSASSSHGGSKEAPEPAPALEVEVPIYFFLAFSIARLTGCGN